MQSKNVKVVNALDMSNLKPAINVETKYVTRREWSRLSMLRWINECLKSDFFKIDELGSGAAYCCLMDILFPDSINMRRVKFATKRLEDFRSNFAMLQKAFKKHAVKKIIPVHELIEGKFQDNYDFLIWFRRFYIANTKENPEEFMVDVEERRYGQSFTVGAANQWCRSRTTLALSNVAHVAPKLRRRSCSTALR